MCLTEVRILFRVCPCPSDIAFSQTYDPTIEDAYRKQLVVDNRMCFVEVIDTAGQGMFRGCRRRRAYLTA